MVWVSLCRNKQNAKHLFASNFTGQSTVNFLNFPSHTSFPLITGFSTMMLFSFDPHDNMRPYQTPRLTYFLLHIGGRCNTWHSHLQTLFQGKRISEFRANQTQGFFCFNLVLAFISPSGECPCPCPWPTCPQARCPARFSVYLPENCACPVTPLPSLNFLVPKLYIYLNPPTLAW